MKKYITAFIVLFIALAAVQYLKQRGLEYSLWFALQWAIITMLFYVLGKRYGCYRCWRSDDTQARQQPIKNKVLD